jgi:molybdopterin/thiamine biosynthesis adenylyltransferase
MPDNPLTPNPCPPRGEGSHRSASVLVAGAGNIGSHLVPLLVRAGISLVCVVDRDRVEAKNLANQDFGPEHIGEFKAEALARTVRGRSEGVMVKARTVDLEDLPLDQFRVDLVLGCLDSRRARQVLVSERAWPLGVPVVDGGVGEGLVGRVQVFVPGEGSACLECGWGDADYRRLAEEYPCTPGARAEAPPTLSPAFAGAMVASLMAAEAVRILAGERGESREVAFDLMHRRFLVSRLRRAPRCRFDHAIVRDVVTLSHKARVGDLLRAAEGAGQLEFGRGLGDGFRAERFVTLERLRARAGKPLAALGLKPGDHVRVRCDRGGSFVIVN